MPVNPAGDMPLEERLFHMTIGALELFSVYLGKRLGLYDALAREGALTFPELAATAGIAERYAQEWLEQQAVAAFLEVDDEASPAAERRYRMPREHVPVLADAEHPRHAAPFAQMLAGVGGALPKVVDAYRSGSGVAYTHYGIDFVHGQGGINRPAFLHDLPARWMPKIPDIHERLHASPPARVADVGCGEGWAAMALARAYPGADVHGFDLDAPSIEAAEAHASRMGLDVRFHCADAAGIPHHGPFDLVLVLEALHDMSRPVQVLSALREALGADGAVVVADERVAESFYAPGDEIERMMYGWSVNHCLPVSMAEQPSAALGTVLRPDTLREVASDAGYRSVEILPIDTDFFRFYRLRP